MNMKKIILSWLVFITTLFTSCQKEEVIVKNFELNGPLNIKTQIVKNELPRASSYILNQDGLKVNAVLDSAQFYDVNNTQQRSVVNGNPNFSRALMEDKPNDREYDMNDAVIDFRYRTLSRSVGGGRGPGNIVPLKTIIDVDFQASGVGDVLGSPEVGLGISLHTLAGTQIFNPDSLISEVKVDGVVKPFIIRNNVIRVVAFSRGHKSKFWNTIRYGNPGIYWPSILTNPLPSHGSANIYTQPLPSNDKVNIEITYNRNAIDNYFKQYGSIVVYHLDPFFTASNFRQFRGDIPFSLIVPTNTAWSSEFIDLRYTYPNLVPTYTNFSNRVDSLAYMR